MSRAENRHHEERIKEKWRRRERQRPNIRKGTVRTMDLSAWKAPRPEAEVEAAAVRRAHHNKCGCSICKGPRYDRRRSRPRKA